MGDTRFEEKIARMLKEETERARVSPDAWRNVEDRIGRRRPARRPLALAMSAAVVAVAVFAATVLLDGGNVTELVGEPTPSTAPAGPAAGWTRCLSTMHGFEIDYPEDWHAPGRSSYDHCRYFDPDVEDIPPDAEAPHTALQAIPTGNTVETLHEHYTDGRFWTVTRTESVEVPAGRATLYEVVSNGQGLDDEGTEVYSYVIDREGNAFEVRTIVHPDLADRYGGYTEVVDDAVRTVRFFAPHASDSDPGDEALHCFFRGRVARDLDAARPCMTDSFAASYDQATFAGPSSPSIERFTVLRDLLCCDPPVRSVSVRAFWATEEQGVYSHSDDEFDLRWDGSVWKVDRWSSGPEQLHEGREAMVTVYHLDGSGNECSGSGPTPADYVGDVWVPVARSVMDEDLPLAALRELFMPIWPGEAAKASAIPVGSRVRSVQIDASTARVDLNDVADRGSASCSGAVKRVAIEKTLEAFGVTEVIVSIGGRTEGAFHG